MAGKEGEKVRFLPEDIDDFYVDAQTGKLVNLTDLYSKVNSGETGASNSDTSFDASAPEAFKLCNIRPITGETADGTVFDVHRDIEAVLREEKSIGWRGEKCEPNEELTQVDYIALLASADGYLYNAEEGIRL